MNEHDDVMYQVRDSFSGLRMDVPVERVFAAGRARRRRRLSGLTGVAAVTAGAAASITLTVSGPGPAHLVQPRPSNPAPPSTHPVQLAAAFTVTSGPGDSTTVVLGKDPQDRLDPSALRQALARHGIPALVTVGNFCRSNPAPRANLSQVLHSTTLADGSDAMVIDGRAMPSGTRLSIGYFSGAVRLGLISDGGSLTCASTFSQPAVHNLPSGTPIRGRQ